METQEKCIGCGEKFDPDWAHTFRKLSCCGMITCCGCYNHNKVHNLFKCQTASLNWKRKQFIQMNGVWDEQKFVHMLYDYKTE